MLFRSSYAGGAATTCSFDCRFARGVFVFLRSFSFFLVITFRRLLAHPRGRRRLNLCLRFRFARADSLIRFGGVGFGVGLEPVSGIEPDPPEYETGARPIELRGQVPAVRVQVPLVPKISERRADSERSARRRRQVIDFVRPSEEVGSFQTRSQNERLTVRLSPPREWWASWSRTNVSIACLTLSSGRTSSNGRNRTFMRKALVAPATRRNAFTRVRKPFRLSR